MNDDCVIPEEAIDAAARAHVKRTGWDWDELGDSSDEDDANRATIIADMRAALQAALPHLQACSCWHRIGKYECPEHPWLDHQMRGDNCTGCGSSQAEITHGLVPMRCPRPAVPRITKTRKEMWRKVLDRLSATADRDQFAPGGPYEAKSYDGPLITPTGAQCGPDDEEPGSDALRGKLDQLWGWAKSGKTRRDSEGGEYYLMSVENVDGLTDAVLALLNGGES